MNHAEAKKMLVDAFHDMGAGKRLRAIMLTLPVIELMNTELVSATQGVASLMPAYRPLRVSRPVVFNILEAQGISRPPLDSVAALGWHSWYKGLEEHRTFVGQLVWDGKQYGPRDYVDTGAVWALSVVTSLTASCLRLTYEANLIVAVPSSEGSLNRLPRDTAYQASVLSELNYAAAGSLILVRAIPQLKYQTRLAEKLTAANNAMWADPSVFQGQKVLLIDDLLGSGSTMREAARALRQAGAIKVHGLAMAKTRQFAQETINPPCQ